MSSPNTNASSSSMSSPPIPSFQRKRPNIRLDWQEAGEGPCEGETAYISFLKQGFFLAIRDSEGYTNALCFVPRPKFRVVNGRTIVEAETTGDDHDDDVGVGGVGGGSVEVA